MKSLKFFSILAVALMAMYPAISFAQQSNSCPTNQKQACAEKTLGTLSVSGRVTVKSTTARSGDVITTNSAIATKANSSATITLEKLGYIELFPSTSIMLIFDESSITVVLAAGRVQVSTLPGVAAIVMATDGEAVADKSTAATFMVDVECGNLIVASQGGLVQLRAGGKSVAVAN